MTGSQPKAAVLIDQEFEYTCPTCGVTGRLFAWTSASPESWLTARQTNPHRRVCQGCKTGYRVGEYRWRYIGPARAES